MLDLSPEKLLVLLTVGMIVLGPNRLPTAARGLAQGLVAARRLAAGLTDPLHASLAEPRRAFEETIADVKSVIADPLQSVVQPVVDAASPPAAAPPAPAPTDAPPAPTAAAELRAPSDPSLN
ncbi:MAG TPA: twin-arginine translocase TatA/TatE family subunit [Acidimicrobiales bacterium]|nr:twin-arginine translocase TatA/TatE family subunit [Acidimicrobiales bacterium]